LHLQTRLEHNLILLLYHSTPLLLTTQVIKHQLFQKNIFFSISYFFNSTAKQTGTSNVDTNTNITASVGCSSCSSFWSVLCAFSNGCCSKLLSFLGTLLGIGVSQVWGFIPNNKIQSILFSKCFFYKKGGFGIVIWLAKAGYLGPLCSSLWKLIKKLCNCCCCCCGSKKKKDQKYE